MQNKLTRKEIRVLFKIGNRLLKRAIASCINPLSDDTNMNRFFEWVDTLPQELICYFNKALSEGIEAVTYHYNRPRVRGTDGRLYSYADMDDAMMFS